MLIMVFVVPIRNTLLPVLALMIGILTSNVYILCKIALSSSTTDLSPFVSGMKGIGAP